MPYIMVMGSLTAPHLSKDEGATVYGLNSEERTSLVQELNSSFGMRVATTSDTERTVRVTQKGLTLLLVNRVHGLLGYDVVSHAMAMTNTNRELASFTMYKKSNSSSHHGHSSSGSHGHGTSSSHGHGTSSSHAHGSSSSHGHSHRHVHGHDHSTGHKGHTHGDVVTLL